MGLRKQYLNQDPMSQAGLSNDAEEETSKSLVEADNRFARDVLAFTALAAFTVGAVIARESVRRNK